MEKQVSQMTLVSGIMGFIGNEYPDFPMNARQYNAIIQAANALAEELNSPHKAAIEGMGLDAWLHSDDVGTSSKFLAFKLSGSPLARCGYSHPYDPADFQRCRKMLDAIPKLKGKLNAISSESEIWAGLVRDWDSICQLIDDNKSHEAYSLITKNH